MNTFEERIDAAKEKVASLELLPEIIGATTAIKDNGSGKYAFGDESRDGHSSLVINKAEGKWYWNSRGLSGDVFTWLMEVAYPGMKFRDALEMVESIVGGSYIAPTPERQPKPRAETKVQPLDLDLAVRYHMLALESDEAMAWWLKRGITQQSVESYVLGYKPDHWKKGPASTIPFISDGKLKTIRCRVWGAKDDDARYLPERTGLGSHVFNIDVCAGAEDVVIFEGEIKAMVLSQLGENGIAISGCQNLPEVYLPLIAAVPTVYVCLDFKLNSEFPTSPYSIRWVQKLSEMTDVRILSLPYKPDDLVLTAKDGYKMFLGHKRSARKVLKEDIESAKKWRQGQLTQAASHGKI